jgi:integrase
VYAPVAHKTRWRGKARAVLIGPQGQELLRAYFTADPADYLFSPRRATAEFHAARSAARKTPRYASHMARNAKKRAAAPKRVPAERYTLDAYNQAVERACERAGVPAWSPNRVRHTFATLVRKQFGLEATQVVLGHAKADVTQVYAERNLALGLDVARRVG